MEVKNQANPLSLANQGTNQNVENNSSLNQTKKSLINNLGLDNTAYKLDLSSFDKENEFKSEFGYRVDEKGFFDERFNMAARLPSGYKMEINNIKSIKAMLSDKDLFHTLNSYFNLLSSINPSFKENSSLSHEEAKKLVAGFSSSDSLDTLYQNDAKLKHALSQNKNLLSMNLYNNITSFHFDKAFKSNANDKLIKPFLNTDGSIQKAGLLLNFIRHDLASKNAKTGDLDAKINDFKQMLKDDNKQFITKQNKPSMSFDLYLYINSMDKNKMNEDKLELAFKQYQDFAKQKNMDNFMNESVLWGDYLSDRTNFLDKIKQDFKPDESLIKIDENISNQNKRFIKQRHTELSMQKAIKAYISFI